MSTELLSLEGTQVTIDLSRAMLTSEENIQESLNHADRVATEAALEYTAVSNPKLQQFSIA